MDGKKQVLVVTNAITEEEVLQIRKAFDSEVMADMGVKLSLVHVIPHLPTCYFNIPSMGVLVEKYFDEAKESLHQVGKHLAVAKKINGLFLERFVLKYCV